jgi:hypothetical protein
VLEKDSHGIDAALGRGYDERRVAVVVTLLDVGAAPQEELDDVGVVEGAGHDQWRLGLGVLTVYHSLALKVN